MKGNFGKNLIKFLKNKNTITIIGVILCVVILYVGYNMRVKQAINPILVPVAKVDIQPRTLITEEMIEYIQVPPAMITTGTIREKNDIVNNYSNYNTLIPAGSLFFSSTVITKAELPDAATIATPEGQVLFNFPVTMATTYGNSMMPNDYIDIYFKGRDENNKVMIGKLVSNVKILAVKDSSGRNVFESTEEARVPAYIYFAVDPELHLLLRKCMYLSSLAVELIPVPNNVIYTEGEEATEVSSQYLYEYIEAKTAFIPEDELDDPDATEGENGKAEGGEKTNE